MQRFINAIPVIIALGLLVIVGGQYGDARAEQQEAQASFEARQLSFD